MPEEVSNLATGSGFEIQEARSCPLTPPESLDNVEQPQNLIVSEAGFVAMMFTKKVE